jgi:tRNA-Thr(GGU) m(6)t(6)A37 methyltransferase TsaA
VTAWRRPNDPHMVLVAMKNTAIMIRPIGIIHSEHLSAERTPIQPVYAKGCLGRVEVFPEFMAGLRDLEGFSHLFLIYHFHKAGAVKLIVKPFLQDVERGVFATRAPCRPNAIGLSSVKLLRRDGRMLYVDGVDILDGTPLLDIKPFVTRFDHIKQARSGWQDDVDEKTAEKKGKRNGH